MKKKNRLSGLLLALLLLGSLLPLGSTAASTVYFTSVNDTIRDLNDETMPFWADGMLYVPNTAIDTGSMPKELGIYSSYNREKQLVTLVKSRKVLIFDIAAGTVTDNNEEEYPGRAIVRGGYAFLPVDTVAKYFGLSYSCTKVTYGYLVRIRSDAAVLSDSKFIDAAATPMAERYRQYEKAHQPAVEEPVKTEPEEEERPTERTTAYLVVEATDAASAERILRAAGAGNVTFLLGEKALSGNDDLLRRIIISGSAAALCVDAAQDAEHTLAAIERANELLWIAGNTKTRLVYLKGGSDAVTAEVRDAGYCTLSFDLNYSGGLPSAANTANAILSKTEHKGRCTVFMGSDERAASLLTGMISRLTAESCTLRRLNELTA